MLKISPDYFNAKILDVQKDKLDCVNEFK